MKKSSKHKTKRSAGAAVTLPKAFQQVIQYWQTSLVDAERMEISGANVKSYGTEIEFADLVKGRCASKVPALLHDRQMSLQLKNKKPGVHSARFETDKIDNLAVLISPLRFNWAAKIDPRELGFPRYFEPLWIPADLTQHGELIVPQRRLPWIPRVLLEPLAADDGFTIGDVADLEEFTRKNQIEEFNSWKDYWAWCNALFKSATGSSISEFSANDYQRRKNAAIIVDISSQGSNRQAMRIYEQILRGKRLPGLVTELASLKKRSEIYVKRTPGNLRRGTLKHLGQFEYSFSLSPSQRNAVHQFLQIKDGQLLTVTGPPGTGKTTLLQSIIGSLWVQAALHRLLPPVIVACAGTNQAVTNVIHSFAKVSTKPGPLCGWWIPEVKSYGCYCPSQAKADDAGDIHLERSDGDGLSRQMETWGYITEARQQYLEHASGYLGHQVSLKRAVNELHRRLKQEVSTLYGGVSLAVDGGIIDWLSTLIGVKKSRTYQEVLSAIEAFDCTHRHVAFQLATHYWEGRWLVEAEGVLSHQARGRDQEGFRGSREDWQRRAMITPCFVGTFSTIPRFFGEIPESNKPMIDLLIVDEASQVLPEDGAACFALASRALVVGDPQQLDPVRSIAEHVDIENLKQHRLIRGVNEERYNVILRKGINSSHGSIMQLAQSACRYIDQNTIGVFLSEHRRSVHEIIEYCNEIAYSRRLVPLREPLRDRLLPAMGYAHIPGVSSLSGSSRKNELEAQVIATWLNDNRKNIEQFYQGENIANLVGIITPFAAQKRLLETELRPRYRQMTIGTVHSLQGAERRIIIFSPVYDQFARANYFFDRGLQMLNVAVSRAQDSFLVFGDMAIFDPRKSTPSGLLARYLLRSDENEVMNVVVPERPGFVKDEVKRLAGLEQHREILKHAFDSAKKELLIVTPTISSRAIEEDNIPQQISSAVSRGVKVNVFVDIYLNSEGDGLTLKPAAAAGCRLIKQVGASLNFARGIHNKTLAIDRDLIVEGSFNWLSAVRDIRSKYQKLEVSFCYSGPKAAVEIESTNELLSFLKEPNVFKPS